MSRGSEQWIVNVEWTNSSPTYHGPFPTGDAAEAWAEDEFDNNPAVHSWNVEILTAVTS